MILLRIDGVQKSTWPTYRSCSDEFVVVGVEMLERLTKKSRIMVETSIEVTARLHSAGAGKTCVEEPGSVQIASGRSKCHVCTFEKAHFAPIAAIQVHIGGVAERQLRSSSGVMISHGRDDLSSTCHSSSLPCN